MNTLSDLDFANEWNCRTVKRSSFSYYCYHYHSFSAKQPWFRRKHESTSHRLYWPPANLRKWTKRLVFLTLILIFMRRLRINTLTNTIRLIKFDRTITFVYLFWCQLYSRRVLKCVNVLIKILWTVQKIHRLIDIALHNSYIYTHLKL